MNDPRLEAMGDTPGSDVCGCTRASEQQLEQAWKDYEVQREYADEQYRKALAAEAELKRVRAERDELREFITRMSKETVRRDWAEQRQARLDRAVEALRMVAVGGQGGGTGENLAKLATRALAEIEESG